MISHSADETRRIAAELAATLKAGDVLALVGQLGAGKTCFVQGLAQGLEISHDARICSPTFTLIHEYSGRLPLYHVDLYRLTSAQAARDLGLDEYFHSDGVCVVEWADMFPELMPAHARWVELRVVDDCQREIILPHW